MTKEIQVDHRIILELIEPGSTVLDLGCGDGELLELLIKEKNVKGQGIEIDEQAIYQCVARGVNVIHGDIDSGLSEYNDGSFDYLILNQSLQQIRHVEPVMNDALRVGRKVVVGFPNFAHYRARLQMFFGGKAPRTGALPFQWYESPNLHFLSIADFMDYCGSRKIKIEGRFFAGSSRRLNLLPNLFAQLAIFLIKKGP